MHGAHGGCNSKSPRGGSREHVASKQAAPELIALAPKGMTADSSRSARKSIGAMNAFAIAPSRSLHEILRAAMNAACHSGHLDMTGWCGESFSYFSDVNTNVRKFCPFSGPERNSSMRQMRADRLDRVLASMRLDERDQHFPRRSSSAWTKTTMPCAGTRWRASARRSPVPAALVALDRPGPHCASGRPGLRLTVPMSAASRPCSRSSRRSTASQPIVTGTRAHAPGTGAPLAHALQANTSLLDFPLLHPLKNWSLRETRGGSVLPALVIVGRE